jgi:hypothetical protein
VLEKSVIRVFKISSGPQSMMPTEGLDAPGKFLLSLFKNFFGASKKLLKDEFAYFA